MSYNNSNSNNSSNNSSNSGLINSVQSLMSSVTGSITLDKAEEIFKEVRGLLGVSKSGSGAHMTLVREEEELRVYVGLGLFSFKGGLVVDVNGHVYRGIALIKTKKGKATGMYFLNAYAAFVRQFLHALRSAFEGNSNYKYVADNICPDVLMRLEKLDWSSKTSDSYDHLDGGSEHVLKNSYVPTQINGSGDYCKAKTGVVIQSIPLAHQRGMAHAFNKNVFLTGTLCHVYPDSSIVAHLAQLGIELDVERYVVCISSKKQKGTKRVLLPMAQVASVVGAKSSGYKLVDQARAIEGHLCKAVFLPTVAFPPGMSAWTGPEENLPVGLIYSNQRGFEVEARLEQEDVLGAVSFEDLGCTPQISRDGNGYKAVFSDCFVKEGDIVASCLGSVMLASFTGKLLEVRWQLTTSMSNTRRVAISARYVREERVFKGRSICKAQFVQTDPSLIVNSLNEGVERPDVVHFMDGIKADTTYAWLIPAATSAIHNEDKRALDMMRVINFAVEGVAHCDYLRIDPAYVLRGIYDEFLSHFKATYGRQLWVQFPSAGDFNWMMEQLYVENTPKGWSEVPIDQLDADRKFKLGDFQCRAFSDGDVSKEHTNVLVFCYSNGQLVAHFQRGFGFYGCKNVEGFELASVQQCVGSSSMLPNNIRSIERIQRSSEDNLRKEVDDMMTNGHKRRVVIRTLHLMNSGVTNFGKWECDLRTPAGVAHLHQLLINGIGQASKSELFKVFCQLTEDYTFIIGDKKSLWLPGIYAVNRAATDSDAGMSIAGVVREMFLYIASSTNAEMESVNQYCRRVCGLLSAILSPTAESSWKFQGGRTAAAAKRIAIPQCPIGEVWVLESEDENSIYAEFKSAGLINGATTIGSRMPMADGAVRKVRVVTKEENNSMFFRLSAYQVGVSPLACVVDKGDFDGDGEFNARLNGEWKVTSREDVLSHFKMTTGSDLFDTECEAYARDHYGIKQWSQIQFGVLKKCVMTKEEYAVGQQRAYEVQAQMVGGMFTLWQVTDISEHLLRGLREAGVPTPERQAWASVAGVETVGHMAEQYEVPLGGYSDAAYTLWQIVRGIQPNPDAPLFLVTPDLLPQLARALAEMGAYQGPDKEERSADSSLRFASAVNTVSLYRYLAALVALGRDEEAHALAGVRYPDMDTSLTVFLACASHVLFESARGTNAGFTFCDGLSAAGFIDYEATLRYVMRFHAENREQSWYQNWVENCSSMRMLLHNMLRDLAPALVGSSALGLRPEEKELFLIKKEEVMVTVTEAVATTVTVPSVSATFKFLEIVDNAADAATTVVDNAPIDSIESAPVEDDGWMSDCPEETVAAGSMAQLEAMMVTAPAPAPAPAAPKAPATPAASAPAPTWVASIKSKSSKPTVGKAVMIFSAMSKGGKIIPCNNNLEAGLTGDYRQPIRSHGGPNYAAFGFSSHAHGMDPYQMSPIGFVGGRYQVARRQWVTTAKVFMADGSVPSLRRQVVGVVDHELLEAGDAQRGIAAIDHFSAREVLLNGGSDKEGYYDVQSKGILDTLADGQRHWFVIVGDISAVDELPGNDTDGQSRIRFAAANIYALPLGVFDNALPEGLKAHNLLHL